VAVCFWGPNSLYLSLVFNVAREEVRGLAQRALVKASSGERLGRRDSSDRRAVTSIYSGFRKVLGRRETSWTIGKYLAAGVDGFYGDRLRRL
jgi:hypothetical protein